MECYGVLLGVFKLGIGFYRGDWQLTYKIAVLRIDRSDCMMAEPHDCLFLSESAIDVNCQLMLALSYSVLRTCTPYFGVADGQCLDREPSYLITQLESQLQSHNMDNECALV